jgi:hypothetical protein
LWAALREAAVAHRLASLKLIVNIPHLHESYYASWRASDARLEDGAWRMAAPLRYGDRTIGRLLVEGRGGGDGLLEMQQFLDFLEPVEGQLARLVEQVAVVGAKPPAVEATSAAIPAT